MSEESKICTKCKVNKPTTHYYIKSKKTGTLRSRCKLCYSNDSAARYRTPEATEARKKVWKKYQRFKLYGITPKIYESMVDSQGGRCLICDVQSDKLCIDHCHDTGKVRGLLCSSCNAGLGFFRDSVDKLEKAIDYLRI